MSQLIDNLILLLSIAGLPYALREAGFFTGLVLLICLGVVTDWTIRLIVLNAKMSGRTTYIDIMDTCKYLASVKTASACTTETGLTTCDVFTFAGFGHRGRAAVSFFQFTFAFGSVRSLRLDVITFPIAD